jgi:hypothetical protein
LPTAPAPAAGGPSGRPALVREVVQAHHGSVEAGATPRRRRHLHRHTPPHGGTSMSSHLLGRTRSTGPFFGAVNEWAQDTPWLHGAVLGFASYGWCCSARSCWPAGGLPGAGDRKPWPPRSGPGQPPCWPWR